MANLQASLRSQCAIAVNQPQQMLQSVNRQFYENAAETAYATLFNAEYDDDSRCLRCANCGHLPALLLRNDNSVERLDSTTTVLGLFGEFDCEMAELPLCPGDTFALYTDGITECCSAADEEFGEQRLVETLRRHRHLPAEALVGAVVDKLKQFSPGEQNDDITLIVAHCRRDEGRHKLSHDPCNLPIDLQNGNRLYFRAKRLRHEINLRLCSKLEND